VFALPTATTLGASSLWHATNVTTQTDTAPGTWVHGSTGYRFTSWQVDGVSQRNWAGEAANPATGISMTDPHAAAARYLQGDLDGDKDNLADWWEHRFFGNTNATPDGDHDGDRLSNAAEFAFGSSPRRADSDGDGSRDGDERVAGTIPTNRQSVFEIETAWLANGVPALRWHSVSGRIYNVMGAAAITGVWSDLWGNTGNGQSMTWTNSVSLEHQLYLRLRVRDE
jgi:hypothetical protein